MKGVVRTLGSSGDTAVEYDTDTGVVAEAEQILRQAVVSQSGIFDGTTREQIRPANRAGGRHLTPQDARGMMESTEEVLIVPRMAGG